MNPIYGTVCIDFDNKKIIDDNGYGCSNKMFFCWLWECAKEPKDGIVSKRTLTEHLKNHRITVGNYSNRTNHMLLPDTTQELLQALSTKGNQLEQQQIAWLTLPEGWTHTKIDK